MSYAHAETVGQRAHWLLDLKVGGALFRIADEEMEISRAVGGTYRYSAGLGDLSVTLGDTPTTVAVVLPGRAPGGDPWALVFARGGAGVLSGATATLRRWVEGQVWERTRTILSGVLTAPEYGGADEDFSFGLERVGDEVTGTIPPAEARIDETTWPVQSSGTAIVVEPDPSVRGAYYPWVFGVPGDGAEGLLWGTTPLSASSTPLYVGSHYKWESYIHSEWIVAGHEVMATVMRIDDVSGGYGRIDQPYENDFAIATDTDLRGRKVAVVPVSTHSRVRLIPGNEYWGTWYSSGGGGLPNSKRDGPMRNAGEIIEYMLRFVGERVDAGRMSAARAYLDRYHLDFCIASPVKPKDWIDEHIGGWLPFVWRESEDGLYLDILRYDATVNDAVLDLVETSGLDTASSGVPVSRSTTIKSGDPRDIENDLTIQYAPMRGQTPLKRRRLAAPGVPGLDGVARPVLQGVSGIAGEYPVRLLGISQARYGWKPTTLQSWVVCEDATADLLLGARAIWKGIARRTLTVAGDACSDLEMAEPGMVVTYSEPAAYLDNAVALVRSVTLSLDSITLDLELLDTPEAPARTSEAYALEASRMSVGDRIVADYAPYSLWIAEAADIMGGSTFAGWRDHTGNGRHMTTLSGAAPTFEASSSALGGQPSVVFNAGPINTTATDYDFFDFTVIAVWVDSSVSTAEEGPTGSNWPAGFYTGYEGADFTQGAVYAGYPYGQLSTFARGTAGATGFTRSGGTQSTYVNGVRTNASALSATQLTATSWKLGGGIGGGDATDMRIAMVGVWNRCLSDAEITSISAIIRAKWGLP